MSKWFLLMSILLKLFLHFVVHPVNEQSYIFVIQKKFPHLDSNQFRCFKSIFEGPCISIPKMIFNVCVTKYSALNKFLRPFYLCSFNVHINVAPTSQKFDLNLLQTTKINISESETDVSSLFACWLKQSCYLAIIIIFRLSNKNYSSFF